MNYKKYLVILMLVVFSFLNVVTFVTRVPAEGLSDIFGAIIPPGAAPGDSVGQQVVGSPTPLPGTGTPTGPITPPVGTSTPAPTGTYTPIVVSGLTYYPQCSSPAIPGAYWGPTPMPGCGTYCSAGCAISSSAMIFSSLSGERKDPKQFMDLYTQYGAPDCLINDTKLTTLFEAHNIDVQQIFYPPSPLSLFSNESQVIVDGYLAAGLTLFVRSTSQPPPAPHGINGYTHWVWIVGKENGHYNVMDPYWSAPRGGSADDFPIIPYTSDRYTSFTYNKLMPVKSKL